MKWRVVVTMECRKVRVQLKDLPQDAWVEVLADDVPKLIEGRGINLRLEVDDVPTHGGLRWDSVALERGSGRIAGPVPGRS